MQYSRDKHTALCVYRDDPHKYRTEQLAAEMFCRKKMCGLVITGLTWISDDKLLRRKHLTVREMDRNAMLKTSKNNHFML